MGGKILSDISSESTQHKVSNYTQYQSSSKNCANSNFGMFFCHFLFFLFVNMGPYGSEGFKRNLF